MYFYLLLALTTLFTYLLPYFVYLLIYFLTLQFFQAVEEFVVEEPCTQMGPPSNPDDSHDAPPAPAALPCYQSMDVDRIQPPRKNTRSPAAQPLTMVTVACPSQPPKITAEERKRRKRQTRLLWKKGNLLYQDHEFQEQKATALPVFSELETPFQFFRYFFDDAIFNHIQEQTMLYIAQINAKITKNVTTDHIKSYIAIHILMPILKAQTARTYWSPVMGVPIIQNAMTVNMFEYLRTHIHFNDNDADKKEDRLFKLRPLLDHLKKIFA